MTQAQTKPQPTPDPENVRIGRRIRSRMGAMRVSQYDIAEAIGLAQPQVHHRLEGRVAFRAHELTAIAARLETTVDRLLGPASPG